MRCSCLGRASLFALLFVVLILSGMRGVAGSWDATPLGVVDWGAFGAGIGDGGAALLAAAGDLLGRFLGAIWSGATAVPWLSAGGAVLGLVGAILAGFLALLRDLGSAALAITGGFARGVGDVMTAGWGSLVGWIRSLAAGPSGEPLDHGRLALFATGWVVLLIVVGWLAVRLMADRLRGLVGRVAMRGCSPSRRRFRARS